MQRLTFHFDSHFGIEVVSCLFFLSGLLATPMCDSTDGLMNCRANNNSDIQQLPDMAQNTSLSFNKDHSVIFKSLLFPELSALHTLTIDLNYVTDLSSGAFKRLSNLENLYLKNSDPYRPLPDVYLKSGSLTGLTALKILDIEEIGLIQIESGAFHDLVTLDQISITQNKVKSVPDSLFATTLLTSLTLSQLGEIQVSSLTFQGLNRLQLFNFHGNKLQALKSSIFSDMINLQELNLENNEITSISISAFTGLRSLERLCLKNNNFTTLEYGVFTDLTSLFLLDMTNCGLQVSTQKYILVFWGKNSLSLHSFKNVSLISHVNNFTRKSSNVYCLTTKHLYLLINF